MDYEQQEKSQGILIDQESMQREVKRFMYAILKRKYEQYVNDPKNPNIAKNIKANFSYKHKFKKVQNAMEAAEGDLRRSQEVKKIIQRTSTSLAG